MHEISLNNIESLLVAACILVLGKFLRDRVTFLRDFFIPIPVIGGIVFAFITLILHYNGNYNIKFDSTLQTLTMITFFTTIGFMASFKFLAKGGVAVAYFLGAATIVVLLQNIIGISLAEVFGLNPLIGLAAGSIPLTGGHGTSAAFGPVLEAAGATGATAVAIASATYGLIAGCLIGGPIGKKLMDKYKLKAHKPLENIKSSVNETIAIDEDLDIHVTEHTLLNSTMYIIISMGIGTWLVHLAERVGIILPIYIGPMIIAAIIRNILDYTNSNVPTKEFTIIGYVSLNIFLAMALMSLRLWDIATLAMPLIVILLTQTLIMGLFAYYITFRIMGRDYDAAVMSCGHCGFGMGATPNAIANMESFTTANFPSPKSFFVIPLVGSLFIDFINATIITGFMNFLG